MAIHTVSSREFAHDIGAAKRAAAEGGTVFITDRGEPAFALLNIEEYRRLIGSTRNLVELLSMPEAEDLDIDFDPVRISARDLEG
jgi:prevent-host-death family protein